MREGGDVGGVELVGAADGGDAGGLAMSESEPNISRSRDRYDAGLGARDRDGGDGMEDNIEVSIGEGAESGAGEDGDASMGGGRLSMAGTRSSGSSSAGNSGEGEHTVLCPQPK